MAFEESARQQDAVRALRALLRSERLPHALLFLGAAGTGRLGAARELARVLLCRGTDSADDCCGRCESCRLMAQGRHPDYAEVGVPEGRQSLPIDVVREVQHTAALKPVLSTRRVFVIRDAERLSIEAANCFLKTLEEPPGACVLTLIASSLRRVPETIVSRCRLVRFRNLPPDVLQRELEAEQLDPEDAHWLARRSWGSPGLARQFKDMELHAFNRQMAEALGTITKEDNFRLSDWLNTVAGKQARSATEARTVLQELLECVALHYRDLAVAAAVQKGGADLCNRALAQTVEKATAGRSPDVFLAQAELVLDTIERIGSNANRQIALDHLFTQLGLADEVRS